MDNLIYLSRISILLGEMNAAENYLGLADKLLSKDYFYSLELVKVYGEFSSFYIKSKRFDKAVMYQQKYIELKDGVFSQQLTRNLMKVEAEHLEKENQNKIEA
jgi:hypothetical protein